MSKKIFGNRSSAVTIISLVLVIAMVALFGGCANNNDASKESSSNDIVEVSSTESEITPDVVPDEVVILEGDASAFSFRSSAPLSEFQEVKMDDVVVDSANYTLTEGSTIVTFTEEFAATVSEGYHKLEIVSTSGTATTAFYAEYGDNVVSWSDKWSGDGTGDNSSAYEENYDPDGPGWIPGWY